MSYGAEGLVQSFPDEAMPNIKAWIERVHNRCVDMPCLSAHCSLISVLPFLAPRTSG